ncbi:MAG: response regulator [Leptolyngbya sp. SIO1D8]|nr:response regulator [Leptolyngbya sp. SIO1D8]
MSPSTVTSSRARKVNKARMLVVDDEPDNLDLLYRTFRRHFNVLRAESGQEALDILAEHGEVAVIISDQRMPEMKGTEFLSKTVPDFPDTVRIILTGFTDVEDLVEAINAGQVYRYITKPWDPDELKQVVEQAAKTYELLKQRGNAIKQSQNQHLLVLTMAEIAQNVNDIETALVAIAKGVQTVVGSKGCAVHLVSDNTLGNKMGVFGDTNTTLLKTDPLVTKAISDRKLQYCVDAANDPDFSIQTAYSAASIRAHFVAPVVFRNSVTAFISLQWENPQQFPEATQNLIKLAAKQTGLTLACL